MTHWLSYGGGVNSTALAILLCEGKLPQYAPWRIVFADTYDERDETNAFIDNVMRPYLRKHGKVLETVCDDEGVLERAERLSVTLNRHFRNCTRDAKLEPIHKHLRAHAKKGDRQIVGIDAGESHRAKADPEDSQPKITTWPRIYPLIDLDIDRDGCKAIINRAGLVVPAKSGCWHCPFLRKSEIIELAAKDRERFGRIINLEMAATEKHGPMPSGEPRHQWRRPATDYAKMACESQSSGPLFQDSDPDAPCACYDG